MKHYHPAEKKYDSRAADESRVDILKRNFRRYLRIQGLLLRITMLRDFSDVIKKITKHGKIYK